MKDIAFNIAIFFSLLLLQVLICNHIAIFNVAIPLIFIYFIIRQPIDISLSLLLTLSFLMGFSVDIFSDTLGVNCLACILLAVIKKPLLFAYIARDDRTLHIIPTSANIGLASYSKYCLTLTAIYCFLVFTIEYFNFADVKDIVIMTMASTILTFVVLLGIDRLLVSTK